MSFGKKYDKEGAFIRHYLPVLKDMPAKYIYEPWKMSLAEQKAAGCVLGRDYPERVRSRNHAPVHPHPSFSPPGARRPARKPIRSKETPS